MTNPDPPAFRNEVVAGSNGESTQGSYLEATSRQPLVMTEGRGPEIARNELGSGQLSQSVVQQVLRGIGSIEQLSGTRQTWQADSSRVRIQLDPPELGNVAVEIVRGSEVTRIKIVTELPIAHTMLERNIDSLIQSLDTQHGHSFEVDVDQRGMDQHADSQRYEWLDADERPRQDGATGQQPGQGNPPGEPSSTADGLDMVV